MQHVTGYFHQVTQLLQTLTNAVLDAKILQEETTKRAVEINIGTRV